MKSVRELFLNIMQFKKPDRAPIWDVEGIMEQTERLWYKKGDIPREVKASSIMGYDSQLFTFNFGDQFPLPAFTPKVLSVEGDYITTVDPFGFVVKRHRLNTLTPTDYVYIGAPLSTREDWEKMKKRYDPTDVRRYPSYWGDELFEYYNETSRPVTIGMNWGPARGIKNGYMFGFDRFMQLLINEPEVLEDMFEFWADFIIRYLEPFIDKLQVDSFIFKEDGMGYKNSTLISPKMFKNIYQPHMKRVVDFLHSKNVRVIGYYSSGNLKPLIPRFIETGINLLVPLECAAEMDAVELRKEYGKDLLMIGNISREAVMKDKASVEKEVMSKVPFLMEKGGYIPAIDDAVMPDMSYENVKYCIDLIKEFKL